MPSTVATIIVMIAMEIESLIELHMSALAHGCFQAFVENLFQMKLYLFAGWLNENSSMTAFGAIRKTKISVETNSRWRLDRVEGLGDHSRSSVPAFLT